MLHLTVPFALALLASTAAAQLPCFTTNLGTSLGIGDEAMSAAQPLGFTFAYGGATYTDIQVCDNGYVALGASGGVAYWDPTVAGLLADPFPSIRPFWVDLDPSATGSGQVYFRAVPASGSTPAHAIVTWDRVFEYFGTTPHTVQLVLIDGGAIRIHYGQDLAQNPAIAPWLIGASPGNGATANPVSFAAMPLLTLGNPTLHETGAGPTVCAGRTYDWTPDGNGGFVIAEWTACAAAVPYGEGCVGRYGSVYQHFVTTPSIDLANSAFRLLFSGSNYVLLPSSATFVAPSAAATNLNLTDDSETTISLAAPLSHPGGTTATLNVCSNGHVSVASNNASQDYTPSPVELLNWPNATWAVWRDLIPNATSNVWFEHVGGIAIVTWLNLVGYAGQTPGSTPSTFQLQFELATGHVDFVFGNLDTTSVSTWNNGAGDGWVVGFSPAGPSLESGNRDLTAAVPATVTLYANEVAPLAIAASGSPGAGTSISLLTTNVPAGSPFGAVLLGFQKFDPGLPLAGIGMNGCFRYTDGAASLLFLPTGSTGTVALAIPNFPGVSIHTQSVVFAPSVGLTTLGAIASGGLSLDIQ